MVMCSLFKLFRIRVSIVLVSCFCILSSYPASAGDSIVKVGQNKIRGTNQPITRGWEPVNTTRSPGFKSKLQIHTKPASLIKKLKQLTDADYDAALQAVHFALSQGPDGSIYNWRRPKTNLIGKIIPINVFRGQDGRLCRHFIYTLSIEKYKKTTEGIACRSLNGSWNLAG